MIRIVWKDFQCVPTQNPAKMSFVVEIRRQN